MTTVNLRPSVMYALSLDFLDSEAAHYEAAGEPKLYATAIIPREAFEKLGRPGFVTVEVRQEWDEG